MTQDRDQPDDRPDKDRRPEPERDDERPPRELPEPLQGPDVSLPV